MIFCPEFFQRHIDTAFGILWTYEENTPLTDQRISDTCSHAASRKAQSREWIKSTFLYWRIVLSENRGGEGDVYMDTQRGTHNNIGGDTQ